MGCSNSAEDNPPEEDYDGVTGQTGKKKQSTLDFSGQGLVVLPTIPRPGMIKNLQLSNNFLTRLPKDMSTWTHLEEVGLGSNRLVRVPEGLTTVATLTSLDLSNNPLSRTGGFDALASLTRLKKLNLSMTAIKQFPPMLSRCSKLTELDVGYNQMIDVGIGDILRSMPHLTSINISYCCLRGSIPPAVQNCDALTHLNISGNTGLDLHPSYTFGKLASHLEVLYLGACSLRSVPGGVLALTSLKELHLPTNQYLSSLTGIGALKRLVYLDLSECGLRSLPSGLNEVPQLERLDIGSNEPESLANLAQSLPSLNSISVIGSRWASNPNGDDTLWSEICELPNLQQVEWQTWGEKGGKFSVSPYTTKFPLPLCRLKIKQLNGIVVREELFQHTNMVDNLCAVLRDGYYKVDFGYEPNSFVTHYDAMEVMQLRAEDDTDSSRHRHTAGGPSAWSFPCHAGCR